MNIATYETLTGTTVLASQQTRYTALIAQAKTILENQLGYSLDAQNGHSIRYYAYNHRDSYLTIDPCTAITSVKLMEDSEVIYTFTTDDYREHQKYGMIKYLEVCCEVKEARAQCTQLVVDATWQFATPPTDINYLWADMVTYYADVNYNIKSQTLGTHSYTKVDTRPLQDRQANQMVLAKYAGPNGTAVQIPTL